MKTKQNLRIYVILLLLLCFKFRGYAQPAGSNKYNPVNIGSLAVGSSYTNTKNNAPANGYGNNIGQASDDIFYKFTIPVASKVNLSHCASGFDTYMHLLDINGNTIASNDDNGPLCSGLTGVNKVGTYYFNNDGVIYRDTKAGCYYFESRIVSGSITITKLDLTGNGIISGTFNFKLEKEGCPTINATEGRFDMTIQ